MPPVPYPPLRGTFPSRGRLAIRESPLLKRRRAALVKPSTPPLRHPERSRGIFLARPPYARMRPHSNDTLVLPFSPFPHPRFTSLQKGSLHFRASSFIKIDAKRRTSVCKEDFSTSLEMTIRQKRLVFRRGVLATSKPISRLHTIPSHSVRRRQETDFPSPLPLPSPVRRGQACGPHRGSHS